MGHNPFVDLIGEELSAVCMVRDYVEFHFDGPVVRALTNPSGLWHGDQWRFADPGSTDTLRRYIGLEVTGVDLDAGRHIALEFAHNHRIVISLRTEDRTGPEAAHFVGADERGRPDPSTMGIW